MRTVVFLSTLSLMIPSPAAAQFPDKFTNLRALPKDIAKAELESTMRGFAFALDVRCEHCHVRGPDKKFDYAADDKAEKRTARVMIEMVAAINRDYMARVGKPAPIAVECVTCHHGLTQPRPLNDVLAEAAGKEGIAAAAALYRDLRGKYYGTGQYDFGETPLNRFTEALLHAGKPKDAVAVMEMNFAANDPRSMWAYHMLAMAHQANGEVDKAVADYRKVLEIHPEDTWARQQIEALAPPRK